MFCRICGKEVADDVRFCPYCGADLSEQMTEEVVDAVEATSENDDNGPWKVFALIGFILGIVSLAGSLFFIGLTTGVPGIVFSILGKKSNNPDRQSQAAKGLKLSIWGLIVSVVVYIVFIVVLVILVANGTIDKEVLDFFGIDVNFGA